MTILSIFGLGSQEIFLLLIIALFIFPLIYCIYHVLVKSNLELTPKLLWIIILCIAPILGVIAYMIYNLSKSRVSQS